ncbi:hypothetical protein CAL7102_10210 [Dulcicalothrix desertica PCC 7102]|nr:hypothetical protein CAL7102_10210 [Dulcicalothrix desertica PCC 7102]
MQLPETLLQRKQESLLTAPFFQPMTTQQE